MKNKTRLLIAVMEELAGNAHVSFEGDLHGFRLSHISGASDQETAVLKRNTRRPRQDFIVAPLDPASIGTMMAAIGGSVSRKILHVQIEKGDALEFAAYDNFHAGCVLFGRAVSRDLLRSLESQGVLSSLSVPNRQ